MYTQTHTPTAGGGGNLTPPRRFWYVAVLQIDFTFSGKPLIFLTRRGQFYGWWHCWRPVTSPTMVAILAAILKTWEDLRFIGTQIKKPGHWMHQQFLCRLSLGCTRKLTPPRRGGGDFNPPRSFWYVAVLQIDFIFSGKPLIFLTRRGQFYGWWHCWRPVTSPTMVAILAAILDFNKN